MAARHGASLLIVVACTSGSGSSNEEGAAPSATVMVAGLPPAVRNARAAAPFPPSHTAALPSGFLKGQLHAHTGRSGDAGTPPERVHAWYEARGYDFIVFTDHNTVTDTPDTDLLTIPGVEVTQNLRTCEPAPLPEHACLLHVNVLFAGARGDAPIAPARSYERAALYGRALDAARDLGGLAMLNHPNMHFGASADVVASLAERGLGLMEVGNQSWDSQNEGDADHPSTEALWDAALSRGLRLWGTVTDDAHHYDDAAEARARGERVYVGDLGFVAVRAEKQPSAIRRAIEGGDFYGTTGVVFSTYRLDADRIVLESAGDEALTFEVVADGRVVRTERGKRLEHVPDRSDGRYARVRARSATAFALTQPVFLP